MVAEAHLPPVEFPDRVQVREVGLTLTTLAFPGPGRDGFRLVRNGRLLAQKDFPVTMAMAPQG